MYTRHMTMKYAFIFGTSIYISSERFISYADAETKTSFLKIVSFYAHYNNAEDSVLSIDADISSSDSNKVVLNANKPYTESDLKIIADQKRVQIFKAGHEDAVLDVMQLDKHEFNALSSHMANEIEAQHIDVVFKIKGDFSVNNHRIVIDGETLYVNGDSFANGVVNAHEGVILTGNDKRD